MYALCSHWQSSVPLNLRNLWRNINVLARLIELVSLPGNHCLTIAICVESIQTNCSFLNSLSLTRIFFPTSICELCSLYVSFYRLSSWIVVRRAQLNRLPNVETQTVAHITIVNKRGNDQTVQNHLLGMLLRANVWIVVRITTSMGSIGLWQRHRFDVIFQQ